MKIEFGSDKSIYFQEKQIGIYEFISNDDFNSLYLKYLFLFYYKK